MTEVERSASLLHPAAAFATFTAVMWRTREAVEHLLFAVVKEQLILEAPAYRWLGKADDELRAALSGLRAYEEARVAAVREITAGLGLPPSATLAELSHFAPTPWPVILCDHRLALRVLVRDLEEPLADTMRLLRASSRAVRDTLADLDEEARSRPNGRDLNEDLRAVDRAMLVTAADVNHQNALETTARLVRLSLFEFLA